jgi:diguanylate cyclase (GGDEF)-like protein/PAS domain S-box-containing protein
LQNSSEVVTIVDLDGTLRFASPAFERVLGYDPKHVVGTMNVLDHVHLDDLPHVLEETEKAVAEGGVVTNKAEYRFRHRDGSWRWMESTGTYLLDDPTVGGVVVASRDITERKETEEALRDAEERYRALVEQIPAVTYIDRATDGPDEPLYTSPQIEGMLGYAPEEWLGGRLWPERLHPDDKERVLSADERFEAGKEERFSEEYRLVAKDGRVVWVREEAVTIRGEAGEPLYWQGVIFDITERVRAEERLAESEQRFRSAFEDAGIGMTIATPDGRYLKANKAFCGMVGYAEDELLGMTFRDITHSDDLEEDLKLGRGVLAGEDRSYSMEKRYARKDGSVVWVHLTVSVVRGSSGEPLYSIAQAQDITGRKRMEERLKRRALRDALTGLPNRKLFVDRLRHALERTRRRKDRKVAVLFMDLDGFKVVNDSLGHEAGDLLLTVVAQRLRRHLRPEDTLARFGGDEFVVLLDEVSGPVDAVRVAERITEEFGRPFVLGGRSLFASASVGIALGDARTKTPDDLMRDADTAMYRAKDEHAPFRVFDPSMYERALKRLEFENDLRRAAGAGEFVVLYQPIVDLVTGEVWGMEALARWEHPERGLLDPSEFVPVAEESGLVLALGEHVLEEACRQAKGWQDNPRLPPLVVSVNLSALQLGRPDLAMTIERALRETGFDARRLSLDVTETAYIRALEEQTAALDRLKELGVRLSIDDFGASYSSLSYLKRLPADALKIDRTFLAGLGEEAEDTAIVRMVIDLAHTLGMKVVAEGVEGSAQAALLREMGCDMAQGFYFSEPLPPDVVSRWLAS